MVRFCDKEVADVEYGALNRGIRMLRELSEQPEALEFTDIYPEYQCVKIYGLNELAYFLQYI